MSERIISPPEYRRLGETTPLVFLAGPVQGAPDWQTPLGERLLDARPHIAVASPRRTPENQARLVADKVDKDGQVRWETEFRWRAQMFGVTVVYFAAQDHSLEYPAGRPYAQTSRIEAGEDLMLKRLRPEHRLVFGFDPEYAAQGGGSESYLRERLKILSEKIGRPLPVQHTIDEIYQATLEELEKVTGPLAA